VLKGADITAQIRFNGGTTHTLHLELPKRSWELHQTPSGVVELVDQLLEDYTDIDVARQLNALGMRSGWGHEFNQAIVRRIREQYHLQSQYERLRARGLLTKQEIAERLDVQPDTIKKWRRAGLLRAHRFTGRGECLFELPDANSPVKYQHQGKKAALSAASKASSNRSGI
jgi:excisionase family DNA binding protein